MQPPAMEDATACMCHRKRLLWHMQAAAFFCMVFNDVKLLLRNPAISPPF